MPDKLASGCGLSKPPEAANRGYRNTAILSMNYDLKDLKKYSSIPPRGDTPFNEYLKGVLTDYTTTQLMHYKKCVLTAQDCKDILDLVARILSAVYYGLKGLPFLSVYIFKENNHLSYASHDFTIGESFYRMRVVENKRELKVEELFHIPFSKQGKVEN